MTRDKISLTFLTSPLGHFDFLYSAALNMLLKIYFSFGSLPRPSTLIPLLSKFAFWLRFPRANYLLDFFSLHNFLSVYFFTKKTLFLSLNINLR